MKITIYEDQIDSHVHFRMFVNGGLAGSLCMTFNEYHDFINILKQGHIGGIDKITIQDERSTGNERVPIHKTVQWD